MSFCPQGKGFSVWYHFQYSFGGLCLGVGSLCGGSMSRGSLSKGLCQWGSRSRRSLSERPPGPRPHIWWRVCILLESFLVLSLNSLNWVTTICTIIKCEILSQMFKASTVKVNCSCLLGNSWKKTKKESTYQKRQNISSDSNWHKYRQIILSKNSNCKMQRHMVNISVLATLLHSVQNQGSRKMMNAKTVAECIDVCERSASE